MVQDTLGIQKARAAARQGSWAEALALFRAAPESSLTPTDLETIADCQWWLCRLDESMATRQLAHQAYAAIGDDQRPAYNAWFLAYDHFSKGEGAIGAGWLARAQRHLADHPECLEHAYLVLADAHAAEGRGEWNEACEFSRRALSIGQRFGDRDVATVALQTLGRELIALGDVSEGLRLLDEAMTSVIARELGDFCTGWVYCNVLITCLELGEVARAGDWSDAATAWCDSLSAATPYNGLCRVYRVGVLSLRGAFTEAERDARRASSELAAFVPVAASAAWYELGEIRRRLGDLTGAEEAFLRAHELGADPQPGLALVRLAQGQLDAAQSGLRTSLANESGSRLIRTRLLAAQVHVALSRGDTATARAATDELRSMESLGSSFLHAHADMAEGTVKLAEDDRVAAIDALQRAWRVWQELKLPYEAAQTRALLGMAAGRAGDEERAQLELRAARQALEELGASADALRIIEMAVRRPRLRGALVGERFRSWASWLLARPIVRSAPSS